MVTDEEMLKDYKLGVKTTSTVGLCHMCEGRGYLVKEVLTSYHRGEYDDTLHECTACETLGLVTAVTKEVVVVPKVYYQTSPKIFYTPYNPVATTQHKLSKE